MELMHNYNIYTRLSRYTCSAGKVNMMQQVQHKNLYSIKKKSLDSVNMQIKTDILVFEQLMQTFC